MTTTGDSWPPPSYVRDPSGRQRRATGTELYEAIRLLAKHADIAEGLHRTGAWSAAPLPVEAVSFLAGLGVDSSRLERLSFPQEPGE